MYGCTNKACCRCCCISFVPSQHLNCYYQPLVCILNWRRGGGRGGRRGCMPKNKNSLTYFRWSTGISKFHFHVNIFLQNFLKALERSPIRVIFLPFFFVQWFLRNSLKVTCLDNHFLKHSRDRKSEWYFPLSFRFAILDDCRNNSV